ncbi:hypothetical protein DFH28DRAFT_1142798 [Melampsora americana]|nr:hypothetical protein DFH28DRAFT_1142798 [Melampsora americana]
MGSHTPTSFKGSNKKRSSSLKKNMDQDTPVSKRRGSSSTSRKQARLSLGNRDTPMTTAGPIAPKRLANDDDEEMRDAAEEPVPPMTTTTVTTATITSTESSQEHLPPTTQEGYGSDDEESHHTSDDASGESHQGSTHENEEEDVEITLDAPAVPGIVTPALMATIAKVKPDTGVDSRFRMLPYPRAGHLRLFTVNPLIDARSWGLAPNANLPYELQYWWQYNHESHTSPSDINLWAMVIRLSDKRGLSDAEVIKDTLHDACNYFRDILGPGGNKFMLVRFKSPPAKDKFLRDTRLDRGVYVTRHGPLKTAILMFNLDPITRLTPQMTSLLLTASGLPGFRRSVRIDRILIPSIKAHSTNDKFKLNDLQELDSIATYTPFGSRVFEVAFSREAFHHWVELLSDPNKFMFITTWNKNGKEIKGDIHPINWRYLPACGQCGTSSYDAGHRFNCPYMQIADAAFEEMDTIRTIKKVEGKEVEGEPPTVASASKPSKKVGGFTRVEA